MKNRLTDLNNHLFAQLERLGDESLEGDKLDLEIQRAKTIIMVAREIIAAGSLLLRAKVAQGQSIPKIIRLPDIFE